jgi:hypothetical protein
MLAMPWAEVEAIFFRPSTVLSRSSSGVVMPFSTSSAEAPVHTTRTLITSSAKVGKNCTFIRLSASSPTRKATSIITLAATLWRTKTPRTLFMMRAGSA